MMRIINMFMAEHTTLQLFNDKLFDAVAWKGSEEISPDANLCAATWPKSAPLNRQTENP
jgi:hypothetical protein